MYKIFSNSNGKEQAFNSLNEIVSDLGSKKILVLTGKSSFKRSKSKEFLMGELSNYKDKLHFYSDFRNNPNIEDLNKAIKKLESIKFDLIIACGGGSVIDFSKLLKIYLSNSESIKDFPAKFCIPDKSKISLIAIPTTAGTGSEVTHFSVLYKDSIKYSIASHAMVPEYSILNPLICQNASFKIKASCIVDAFSQAIESYWSVHANQESSEFASKAIKLINKNIHNYSSIHQNLDVISEIQLGAYYSGKAINISKTTAPHALSYSLTSHFDIPHGQAVGMTLGQFFLINEVGIDRKNVNTKNISMHSAKMESLRKLLGWGDPFSCLERWKKIMKELELEMQIQKETNEDKLIKDLVDTVNLERLKNNPIKVSEKDVAHLYKNIFD